MCLGTVPACKHVTLQYYATPVQQHCKKLAIRKPVMDTFVETVRELLQLGSFLRP